MRFKKIIIRTSLTFTKLFFLLRRCHFFSACTPQLVSVSPEGAAIWKSSQLLVHHEDKHYISMEVNNVRTAVFC